MIVVKSNKLTQEGIGGISEIFKHSYLFGYNEREDESYRPITLSTFAIEKSVFDSKSSASHFIQVLLYALCVLVLFKFLQNLFGEERQKLVIAITLLFMLHPIHTEVVANVKSRDELLSALFLFSSLYFYSRWILFQHKSLLIGSLLLFFAATLSKETAVLGVLLFPATYYYMKTASILDVVKKSLLFAIPFLLYFGIRAMVLTDVLIQDPIDPVANSLALAQTNSELFATNFSIFAKYLQLTILPIQMSWDYSISTFPLVPFTNWQSLIGLLGLLVLLGLFAFGIIKRKLFGFGALLFISTFALTSNFFFLINCNLGERFLFMPVLGIIIMAVLGVDAIVSDKTKALKIGLFGIFVVFFIGRTVSRSADWKNNLAIYESGIVVSPNSIKAHFNLATEYLEQGNRTVNNVDKESWFKQSIDEFVVAKNIYTNYVNIYENMGFVYAEYGKIASTKEQSIDLYNKGLLELNFAIDSLKLDKPSLFQNKYFILEQLIALQESPKVKNALMVDMVRTVGLSKKKSAEDYQRQIYYLRILKEDDQLIAVSKELLANFPDKKDYLLELSQEFFNQQKFDKSLELMTIFVNQFPADLSAKSNKGMLLEIVGKKKEALKVYEEILAIDPNQAHTRNLHDKLFQTIN